MRFEIPDAPKGPEFDGFADCIDYAMESKSRLEEGEFIIALSSFIERLVANLASGRDVWFMAAGRFTTVADPPPAGSVNGHGVSRRSPVFAPGDGFQAEVNDPLPPDHFTMKGILPSTDDVGSEHPEDE